MIYQPLMLYAQKTRIGILNSTLDLAGTQAARADVYAFHFTVNNRTDTLNVRLPDALGLQMGVADVHARLLPLCADFANTCHVLHLLSSIRRIKYPQTQRIYSILANSKIYISLQLARGICRERKSFPFGKFQRFLV